MTCNTRDLWDTRDLCVLKEVANLVILEPLKKDGEGGRAWGR